MSAQRLRLHCAPGCAVMRAARPVAPRRGPPSRRRPVTFASAARWALNVLCVVVGAVPPC
eukprot:10136132-Alexandrium_andersonii.AAC.1